MNKETNYITMLKFLLIDCLLEYDIAKTTNMLLMEHPVYIRIVSNTMTKIHIYIMDSLIVRH